MTSTRATSRLRLPALIGCAALWLFAGSVARAAVNPGSYSFLTAPTNQLGVPGYQAGGELTPNAGVYTGYGEVDWRVGTAQSPLPVLGRVLVDRETPIEVLGLARGGIRYELTVVSNAAGGEPVEFIRVVMRNVTQRAATAEWGSVLSYAGGAAPFQNGFLFHFDPLVPENPDWTYTRDGREMVRSGQVIEIVPAGGQAAPGDDGVSYSRRLEPGGVWELDFAVPVLPADAGSPGVAQIAAAQWSDMFIAQDAYWAHLFHEGMQIVLPEPKVTDTFYSSLAVMAQSRYPAVDAPGWVQTPNKLGYNAFYIRDAAFIARAFDVAGLHSLAGQDLDYFPSVQGSDGLYDSQPGQLDGLGEALWAIGQHAQWPGEGAWARSMLPSVTAGVAWLASACATDPDGLVPVSTVDDNELASGHITGDDFLAADGLQAAAALARVAGQPGLAARWQAQLATFEVHLHAALASAEALTGGWIPPDLEDDGGLTWGNLWASYPSPVTLAASSPAVSATLAHVLPSFRQGIATYAGMLHDYLGFRVFETELQRGDSAAVVDGLYAELAHTDATGGGFETDLYPGASRALLNNLAPHGWFAAEYVTLLRNMLVDEDGASAVDIMSAISPDWIQPGDVIGVRNAPTTAGMVSYSLHSSSGGAVLHWHVHLRPGVALRWRLPAASGQSGRVLTLRGPSGSLRVRWRLRGPLPSFSATAGALLAHGS